MSEAKQPEEKPITVHITGPGIAYVEPEEFMQSAKAQRLLQQAGELVERDRKRSPGARQLRQLQETVDKLQQQLDDITMQLEGEKKQPS